MSLAEKKTTAVTKTARVVVADPLPDAGLAPLREVCEVVVNQKWSAEQLKAELATAEALLVRSATKVTAELLAAAPKLRVVARAGVGVDNIDVKACTQRGVIVINSPEGNTVSAAEHAVALILSMARHIPAAHGTMKAGQWKRTQFVGTELYKKSIGIVGLGKIGREVATRLASFNARILAYDPYLTEQVAREMNVEKMELDPLLEQADVVTIHVPLTAETQNLIGKPQLARMKQGARLVNCARGGLVDEMALYEALQSGHLAGAALDVFATEPPPGDSPLLTLDNIVLTPHLGASTEEAQLRVAEDVVDQLREIFSGRPARSPVNFPTLPPEQMAALQPFLFLGEKMGLLLAQLTEGAIQSVDIQYSGEISKLKVAPVTNAIVKGLLSPTVGETVNYVNAPLVAQERGIRVVEAKTSELRDYLTLLQVRIKTDREEKFCEGTLFGTSDTRIVNLDGYRVEVVPSGYKLLTWQQDRPGVVGRVGTLLGEIHVNIAEMQVGRTKRGESAVMVLSVDDAVTREQLEAIRKLDGIEDARTATL
ncbi:MAG: phosphoglycerate dehydrogenase [Candidatus Xenobia bacterium]